MDIETQTSWVTKLIPLVITGLVSLVIGILLEKFKNRLALLKYTISFQSIGTSSQVAHWGAIEVYHNGRLTKHLNFVTIIIENSSNTDQQNLCVDVSCDIESQFLAQSAFYNEGNLPILLEQTHYNYFTDVLKRNQANMEHQSRNTNHVTPQQLADEITWVQSNKKFHLPVFNRQSKITINILVENFKGFIPIVNVNILHKSVRILKDTDAHEEMKKVILWTFCLGLLIFITGFVLLLNHYSTNKEPIILMGVLGLSYSLIGLGIFLFFRFIKRLLS